TQMAMVMGAPLNGWGMVGFWPGVRIVSVRASRPGAEALPFAAYTNGIEECLQLAARQPRLKIIEVAAGTSSDPTAEELAARKDVLGRARELEINVVTAAGNTGGSPNSSAATDPVTAVGASD